MFVFYILAKPRILLVYLYSTYVLTERSAASQTALWGGPRAEIQNPGRAR